MTKEFKSEIRDSLKNELLEKVQKNKYGKYLRKIRLAKLRLFNEQVVLFDFPVTALIGPNGGGKTTILGAAGCIHKSIKPRRFFAKSGHLDDSMKDWKVEYEIIDRSIKNNDSLKRTASFKSYKWKRDAIDRTCVVFGVARTVPANERVELLKCTSPSFKVNKRNIKSLDESVKIAVQKILGKDVSGYSFVKVDKAGRVTLLSGSIEGISYSEFHFGAGESSIIRMVMGIETLPENSLILIEEIENGLHPVATIRMVEYLINVSHRKKSQIIFTTHSNDALKPLPDSAVWTAINGTAIQGKLDIHSLRAITGQVSTCLAVFTEDEFSKQWTSGIINQSKKIHHDSIEIHPVFGDATAIKVTKYHNENPTNKYPALCLLDGDSQHDEDPLQNIYKLPGESPELYVYDKVLDIIDVCKGVLAVALHKKYEEQDRIESTIKRIRLTNSDPHLLYSQVGRELGFISQTTVENAFIYTWCTHYPEESEGIIQPLIELANGGAQPRAREN